MLALTTFGHFGSFLDPQHMSPSMGYSSWFWPEISKMTQNVKKSYFHENGDIWPPMDGLTMGGQMTHPWASCMVHCTVQCTVQCTETTHGHHPWPPWPGMSFSRWLNRNESGWPLWGGSKMITFWVTFWPPFETPFWPKKPLFWGYFGPKWV